MMEDKIRGALFLGGLLVALCFDATRVYSLVIIGFLLALFVILHLWTSRSSSPRPTVARSHPEIGREKAREIAGEYLSRHRAREKVKLIVDEHMETLARRRIILVSVDHYGVVQAEGWNKKVQHFIDKVVRPKLSESEANAIASGGRLSAFFQEAIEERVRARVDEIERQLEVSDRMSPVEFEHWCFNKLSSLGWKAKVTKASGDQGADVIAERDGIVIVMQCKLYSSPVGNKAVQEAFAAQQHYGARASIVMSNVDYTKSARELANTTGVLLCHYSDIGRLDEILKAKGIVRSQD